MDSIRIAVVGAGQIARNQHLPVLSRSPAFRLTAAVSPFEPLDGFPNVATVDELASAHPDVRAVTICTPPQARFGIARDALRHGLHVMLEKPPCSTMAEGESLVEMAADKNVALFAAWHSREAAAVERARLALADCAVRNVEIRWRENVRDMHPGQAWLWQDDGLGVFDPGINALSIVTKILPGRIEFEHAELDIPSNCRTPTAARLDLSGPRGARIRAEFDFLFEGPITWEIEIDSDAGHLLLSKGGAALHIDRNTAAAAPDVDYADLHAEYFNLYSRFAALVRERRVDVDLEPLRLVTEALAGGERRPVEPFYE